MQAFVRFYLAFLLWLAERAGQGLQIVLWLLHVACLYLKWQHHHVIRQKKKNFLNAFRSSFNCSFRKVVGCLDKICIKNFSIWSTWKKVQSLNVEVGISLCIRFLFLFVPCYLVILFLNIWRDKCNQVNFIVTCKNVKMHLFVSSVPYMKQRAVCIGGMS